MRTTCRGSSTAEILDEVSRDCSCTTARANGSLCRSFANRDGSWCVTDGPAHLFAPLQHGSVAESPQHPLCSAAFFWAACCYTRLQLKIQLKENSNFWYLLLCTRGLCLLSLQVNSCRRRALDLRCK